MSSDYRQRQERHVDSNSTREKKSFALAFRDEGLVSRAGKKLRIEENVTTAGQSKTEASAQVPLGSVAHRRGQQLYWDFHIEQGDISTKSGMVVLFAPPNVVVENVRHERTVALRQEYARFCRTQFNWGAVPKDSLNRWLFERSLLDHGGDVLIPYKFEPVIGPSLFSEMLEDIPVKLRPPVQFVTTADVSFRHIDNLCEASEWLLRQHPQRFTDQERDSIRAIVERKRKWVRYNRDVPDGIAKEMLLTTFGEFGRAMQPPMMPVVEQVCVDVAEFADTQARAIIAVQVSAAHQPHVNVSVGHRVELLCNGARLTILKTHMDKLLDLHKIFCGVERDLFVPRVWCLLRRYHTMFGIGRFEGSGLQGSIPPRVFRVLVERFGVSMECFASPLNCYFKRFCSMFADTDAPFGSQGSFFKFQPLSGSFQANPPFSEGVMDKMVDHMEDLLAATERALSFVVFVPDWTNPPSPSIERMKVSRFVKHQFSVAGADHQYVTGFQHRDDKRHYDPVHPSLVFFLQNPAGYARWTPTADRCEKLKTAWKR